MRYQGILGLLVLIADVWAILNIFQSRADNERKLLWTVIVLLLPFAGCVAWYFFGPRTNRA
jgi:hypothetical protein